MAGFHLRWMPSTVALRGWVARVRALSPTLICPQHGSIFRGAAVAQLLDWLDALEVGQWDEGASRLDPDRGAGGLSRYTATIPVAASSGGPHARNRP